MLVPLLALERIHDLISLIIISFGIFAIAPNQFMLHLIREFIIGLIILASIVSVIAYQKTYTKRLIVKVLAYFDSKIQITIMESLFLASRSLRRDLKKFRTKRFLLLTIGMWLFYLAATVILALYFIDDGNSLETWWGRLFSITNYSQESNIIGLTSLSTHYLIFFILIIIFLIIFALFVKNLEKTKFNETSMITAERLTFVDEDARRSFYIDYFAEQDREFCESFFNVNIGHIVLKNLSGASGAKTAMIDTGHSQVYRKYQSKEGIQSLRAQVEKIQNSRSVRYANISEVHDLPGYYAYDMPLDAEFITLSEYQRYLSDNKLSAEIARFIRMYLNEASQISPELYEAKDGQTARQSANSSYLLSRMKGRMATIDELVKFYELDEYENLFVNDLPICSIRDLRQIVWAMQPADIQRNQQAISMLHGDFTPENIVVNLNDLENCYLIDPDPNIRVGDVLIDVSKFCNFFLHDFDRVESARFRIARQNEFSLDTSHLSRYRTIRHAILTLGGTLSEADDLQKLRNLQLIHCFRVLPYQPTETRMKLLLYSLSEYFGREL
jgi:hypothetical protein